ncbi:MAG: uL15 family ribosomal protein [Candidatus Micrarchaeota archaeon]
MAKRKEKQKRGYLGHRSFGNGNCKNKRGAGCRGGKGNAGLSKHRFTWITVNDPDYFGKHGFVRPVGKKIDVLNLFELEQRARLGKLEKKDNKFHFEFKGKILGSGNITVPLVIKAVCWSKSAEKKVKDKGGELISFGKKAVAQ